MAEHPKTEHPKTERLNIRCSELTRTRVKALADKLYGGSETALVEQALDDYFANHGEHAKALSKMTPRALSQLLQELLSEIESRRGKRGE